MVAVVAKLVCLSFARIGMGEDDQPVAIQGEECGHGREHRVPTAGVRPGRHRPNEAGGSHLQHAGQGDKLCLRNI